jgi:hypothetical protein
MTGRRQYIKRPTLRPAVEAAEIELRIWNDFKRLTQIAAPTRITWFANNIRSHLKREGCWLDGPAGADDNHQPPQQGKQKK